MAAPDIRERLCIVMAHPDDEVLWACSLLPVAERVVVAFGDVLCNPELGEGRRRAMDDFPLASLDWLQLPEAGVFESASWPNPRQTAYGLYPYPRLRLMKSFDQQRYRDQFGVMQRLLRPRLAEARNVVVHSPWGEYGHEDHVQLFRVVASLAREMPFKVWVPSYYGEKSAALMRRNLRFFGQPTEPMPIDKALADEISQIYKRTNTWTWLDDYVWPDSEQFLPFHANGAPAGQRMTADRVQRIALPEDYEATRPWRLNRRRDKIRSVLSVINGLRIW